jgi:hypothetical protein
MKRRNIHRLLVGVILIGVCVAIGLSISVYRRTPEKVLLRTDPKESIRELSAVKSSQGILQAHAYFLKNFFSYSDNNRHYLGHFLGEHIYKEFGLSGIVHCYSAIEFGCVHGFLLTGYVAQGEDFLEAVIAKCEQDVPEGCMHGLGHAFLLISGYEREHLRGSLDRCMRLKVEAGIQEQCVQGVYMEYNDRFMVNPEASIDSFEARVFDPDNPLAPCDTEPAELQPVCFRELLLYWTNISSITPEVMVQYCSMISNPQGAYECFWSFGGYIAGDDSTIQGSQAQCEQLDRDARAPCLKGAVMSVAFQAQKPRSSFCRHLPLDIQQECQTW